MGAAQSQQSKDSLPQGHPPVNGSNAGAPPAECPMHKSDAAINPLNKMPELAQTQAPGQTSVLSLERTMSSIPRSEGERAAGASACPVKHDQPAQSAPAPAKTNSWEYPSPQQFYNALVRKGWETPEESVDMMVKIHNWLNEEAWQQIRRWEERHDGGDRSQLARFEGRPSDLSPKARYHLALGYLFPSQYHSIRPFDRHDWLVHRPLASSATAGYTAPSSTQSFSAHRYVIDYYSLGNDARGYPVFSLDVRPAVDSVEAVQDRLTEWWKVKRETWFGASTSERA